MVDYQIIFNLKNKDEVTLTNLRLGWLLIISIIPAGLVGLLLNSWIEENLRSPLVVAFGLIFWGIILWLADYFSQKQNNKKTVEKLTWKNALFIGCAQAVALIPGTSRSGITMTAGLFSKLDRKSTAEFSFLVSVPIIFLAGLSALKNMFESGLGGINLEYLIIGFLAAMMSGFGLCGG
jgi:undecaprenyl-diphosphatase